MSTRVRTQPYRSVNQMTAGRVWFLSRARCVPCVQVRPKLTPHRSLRARRHIRSGRCGRRLRIIPTMGRRRFVVGRSRDREPRKQDIRLWPNRGKCLDSFPGGFLRFASVWLDSFASSVHDTALSCSVYRLIYLVWRCHLLGLISCTWPIYLLRRPAAAAAAAAACTCPIRPSPNHHRAPFLHAPWVEVRDLRQVHLVRLDRVDGAGGVEVDEGVVAWFVYTARV